VIAPLALIFNIVVEDSVLDRVYSALADPTRRRLLVQLRAGPARITDLAAPLPISFAAVARHVSVLERAGLVERRVSGREHWLTARAEPLQDAEAWIAEHEAQWRVRAEALERLLGESGAAG
jgi:DNA-binding transcriptional ArsR family regulator